MNKTNNGKQGGSEIEQFGRTHTFNDLFLTLVIGIGRSNLELSKRPKTSSNLEITLKQYVGIDLVRIGLDYYPVLFRSYFVNINHANIFFNILFFFFSISGCTCVCSELGEFPFFILLRSFLMMDSWLK